MNPPKAGEPPGLTAAVTAFTMVAFAANSVLCRLALGRELIDPISFTTIRVVSGAAALVLVSNLIPGRRTSASTPGPRSAVDGPAPSPRGGRREEDGEARKSRASWTSAVALFTYAVCFSLAYVSLEAGVGALVLFAAVQATMIGAGLWFGERPRPAEWLGLALAIGGLVYLTVPGATAPDPVGVLLMLVSGAAWGVYSLRGKGDVAPVRSTRASFVRASPLALVASVMGFASVRVETPGLLLALASGTITSGLGYVLWYRALQGLTSTRAAIVQLVVPVLAAFGGAAFLAERVTLRLVVASALILGGVAIAVVRRRRPEREMRRVP